MTPRDDRPLGEGSADARSDHFSDLADGYAAHRPSYPPALVDFLVSVAPGRRLAWDAGCGSGQLTARLAERFERVIATDMSPQQIARAAPRENVEYRVARAEASGLPDGVVDLATAAQAAHWFDLEAYYAEVRRVLRPGGVIALVTYRFARIDPEIDAVVHRFYHDVLIPHWPAERRRVEQGYASMPFPFEEIEAPAMEIREERTLDEFVGYVETWSAVRRLRTAEAAADRAPDTVDAEDADGVVGAGAFEAFGRELAEAWGAASARRAVRWPVTLRVGRVGPGTPGNAIHAG